MKYTWPVNIKLLLHQKNKCTKYLGDIRRIQILKIHLELIFDYNKKERKKKAIIKNVVISNRQN